MKTVELPGGEPVPALGLGTWRLGEARSRAAAETASVHEALRLGYRLIDTAEMYGDGGAERIVGAALGRAVAEGLLRREEAFIVSKVFPHNASRRGVEAACARSLQRLGLDVIDLYLLHWRGEHPLAETVAGFEALRRQGRIRHWGVSNFDVKDLAELQAVDEGGRCASNQIWYSAGHRGAEFALLPAIQAQGLPAMAYSPIDQSALARHPRLIELAAERGLTAATLALAWVVRSGRVLAVAKSVRDDHLRQNLAALGVELDDTLLSALDAAFPPPTRAMPLAIN